MKKFVILILMSCFLQACTSAKMAQDLQLGKMTFESGDYKLAFHRLLPLAVDGNPEAQYAVGYMYYYGYGVVQDEQVGLFWMKKSADQFYAPAVEALALIHQHHIKIPHTHHPVFKSGVPQVTSKNIPKTFKKVKVLTKADLPVVKPQVETVVRADNSSDQEPSTVWTYPKDVMEFHNNFGYTLVNYCKYENFEVGVVPTVNYAYPTQAKSVLV